MKSWLATCLYLSVVALAGADEPELTPLHPPKQLVVPMPPPEAVTYQRQSYMARWQFYAVDSQGYFRPRVVLAPTPYYLVNGRPYPLLPVRPTDYIPHIFD